MSRRKARSVLLQLLYNEELNKTVAGELPPYFYEVKLPEKDLEFIRKSFIEIQRKQPQLDSLIEQFTEQSCWSKERLPIIDKNILRIAFAELQRGEVDIPVAINEAVELAKKFSTEESSKFIHGVLSAFVKEKVLHAS